MAGYGDTFLFCDKDDEEAHLNIVITEPTSTGEVITVAVTTRHKKSDAMVPLEVGDHPYIKHPSVLTFAYAKIRTITAIEKVIENGDAKKCEPMDEKFLRRARSALTESEFTPYEVVEFYRGLGLE
jgi:hypothetical protein